MTINPDSQLTAPCEVKSVTCQPVSVFPTNSGFQPAPAKGADGFAAASPNADLVKGGGALWAAVGCASMLLAPIRQSPSDAHPASNSSPINMEPAAVPRKDRNDFVLMLAMTLPYPRDHNNSIGMGTNRLQAWCCIKSHVRSSIHSGVPAHASRRPSALRQAAAARLRQ